jgi:hypothetical protein
MTRLANTENGQLSAAAAWRFAVRQQDKNTSEYVEDNV